MKTKWRRWLPWLLAQALFWLVMGTCLRAQAIPQGVRLPQNILVPVGAQASSSGTYLHYRTLTTDHTQAGSSDSSNFPVAVILNSSNAGTTMKTVANGGHVQNTVTQVGGNGGTEPADLVFGATSTCSTLLPWETETYDGTAGTLIAWVNIGTLSHTANNTFYLCYDASSVTTQQNTGSYAPSYVWDTYSQVVLHFAEASVGNGATLHDSTSNANHATVNGASYAAATGQIDGGINLGNAGNTYGAALGRTIPLSGAWTFSFWAQGQSYSGGDSIAAGNGSQYLAYFDSSNLYTRATDGSYQPIAHGTVTTGTWYRWDVVSDASHNITFYENGSPLGSPGALTAGSSLNILFNLSAGNAYGLGGTADEFRVSTTNRSSDWIKAEYSNQKPGSTFLAVGSEI